MVAAPWSRSTRCTVVWSGKASRCFSSTMLRSGSRSSASTTACMSEQTPGSEATHQVARAEGPGRHGLAEVHAVDQRAQLGRTDHHDIADLMGEAFVARPA